MAPISLLAVQTLYGLLTNGDVVSQQIAQLSAAVGSSVPPITAQQVILTAASPDISDNNMQLVYPRICLFSNALKNTQAEKFRSFSGTVGLTAEIWASGDMVAQLDQWIHVYVESVALVLQGSIGDWGNGIFYSGGYEVQFTGPKTGGLGFVESAKVMLSVDASVS